MPDDATADDARPDRGLDDGCAHGCDASTPSGCGPIDLTVSTPYPPSGYWVFGRTTDCDWRAVLAELHRRGADTVIQFGPLATRRQVDPIGRVLDANGAVDSAFAACERDGQSCHHAALARLQAAAPASSIRHVYTLRTLERFGSALLSCTAGGFEQEIAPAAGGGATRYWQLLLPADDPGDRGCDFSRPRAYDLVLVAGRSEDSVASLLGQATLFGMGVFVGMPAAPMDPAYPWDVWSEARPAFLELCRRVLTDYAQRHGASPALAGVYQTTELPAHDPTLNSVLSLYVAQHALVRAALPGKRILVSPYWDARKAHNGVGVASVGSGVKLVARSDVDIVAPQDSRGTGKVGLFWPYQADQAVDPRLHPAVGQTTYGAAYHASTRELYAAAREAVDELAAQEGRSVELWANLEAFEPGAGAACGSFTTLQRTSKERLDRALTFAGAYAAKVISFMWDGLYTCKAGQAQTLADEIAADWQRPIVVDAFHRNSSGQAGIAIRGYQIAAGEVVLTYYDAAWQLRAARLPLSAGWVDATFGQTRARYPDRLQEIWIPFPWSDLAPSFWIHIDVVGPGGETAQVFSLGY